MRQFIVRAFEEEKTLTSNKDSFFETRLLSRRNGVSVQEKESVLESVLSQVRKNERRSIFARFSTASPKARAALAAISVSLVLIPVCFFLFGGTRKKDEFRAKGQRDVPFFSVSCFDELGKPPCRKGTKLAFRIRPRQDNLYFAAFARRESDGLIYWYFPADEAGKSVSLRDLGEDGILSYGVQLDRTYAPGRYEVFGFLSKAPLDRRIIRRMADGGLTGTRDTIIMSTVSFDVE